VISFFYEYALDRGGGGGVRFEILNGLNFAVGGNESANGAAGDSGGANFERAGTSEDRDNCQRGENSDGYPGARLAESGAASIRIVGRCQPVVFQDAASTTARINLPPEEVPENAAHPSRYMVRCGVGRVDAE